MSNKKPIVDESTKYENCIGKVAEIVEPENTANTLFEGWDEDEEVEWKKHWKGMPEFIQEDNAPYMKIYVSFRTEDDYKEFAKLVDQNLSKKTKSIWYPKLDRDANFLKRWIEE
jgi:hypothetical protein